MSTVVHGAASTLPGIGSGSDVFNLDSNGETRQGGIVVSEQSVDSTSPALCMGIKETNEKEIQRLLNQGTCYCKTSAVDFDFDSFLFQTCFITIVSYLFYLKYPTNYFFSNVINILYSFYTLITVSIDAEAEAEIEIEIDVSILKDVCSYRFNKDAVLQSCQEISSRKIVVQSNVCSNHTVCVPLHENVVAM